MPTDYTTALPAAAGALEARVAALEQEPPEGPPGLPGTDGIDGQDGAPGLPGEPGAAANIAIGTVTTGEPGTNVAIANSGTSNAAIFDFTIPRGTPGLPGNDGINGQDGVTGPQGEPGMGVPSGGTLGQMLSKVTDDDYDTEWIDAPAEASGLTRQILHIGEGVESTTYVGEFEGDVPRRRVNLSVPYEDWLSPGGVVSTTEWSYFYLKNSDELYLLIADYIRLIAVPGLFQSIELQEVSQQDTGNSSNRIDASFLLTDYDGRQAQAEFEIEIDECGDAEINMTITSLFDDGTMHFSLLGVSMEIDAYTEWREGNLLRFDFDDTVGPADDVLVLLSLDLGLFPDSSRLEIPAQISAARCSPHAVFSIFPSLELLGMLSALGMEVLAIFMSCLNLTLSRTWGDNFLEIEIPASKETGSSSSSSSGIDLGNIISELFIALIATANVTAVIRNMQQEENAS